MIKETLFQIFGIRFWKCNIMVRASKIIMVPSLSGANVSVRHSGALLFITLCIITAVCFCVAPPGCPIETFSECQKT